jgi:ATP-dependent RNA helicase DDX49/DBP8
MKGHARWSQAYEGLQTAQQLRQEYLLVPAKVKDVYLVYLLQQLADLAVRSAIVFCSTCAPLNQAPV